jgi:putative oxidoreductase
MRLASTIARYLLGVIFLIFGANGFLHFIPMPPPTGVAGQYMGALFVSNLLVFVFLLQLISAILLLSGRYVALALTLLGPVIVNIFLFHALMAPSGLPLALVVIVLWGLTAAGVWTLFQPLFRSKAYTPASV